MKHALLVFMAALAFRPQSAATQSLPCFEEFHQVFEWDDGGRSWPVARQMACPPTVQIPNDPGSKGLRRGRIEVRQSGADIFYEENEYTWVVEHGERRLCTGAREKHRRIVKVLIDGEVYELHERDGKPPRRTQRHARSFAIGYGAGGAVRPPRDASRGPFHDLGIDKVAGHACQRFAFEPGGKLAMELCAIRLAPECPAARTLQPLAQVLKGTGSADMEGRTTLLETGARGTVLPRGAITPP